MASRLVAGYGSIRSRSRHYGFQVIIASFLPGKILHRSPSGFRFTHYSTPYIICVATFLLYVYLSEVADISD